MKEQYYGMFVVGCCARCYCCIYEQYAGDVDLAIKVFYVIHDNKKYCLPCHIKYNLFQPIVEAIKETFK